MSEQDNLRAELEEERQRRLGVEHALLHARLELDASRAQEQDLRRRSRFPSLLTDIATRFLYMSPEDLAQSVRDALSRIADFTDSHRAYAVRVADGNHVPQMVIEWSR